MKFTHYDWCLLNFFSSDLNCFGWSGQRILAGPGSSAEAVRDEQLIPEDGARIFKRLLSLGIDSME